MMPCIADLPLLVEALPVDTQAVFRRLFYLDAVQGRLHPPGHMLPWIVDQFGSVEKVKSQTIIKITGKFTGESSVFNPLRSLRPHQFKGGLFAGNISSVDFFASPLENTPEDVFGRVKGKYCVTAANIAKADAFHGVIIFNNTDPWDFGCREVADYFETGLRWMQEAHRYDGEACYGFFLWNCTHRAGASIQHGHAQVLLSKGRHMAKVEQLRNAAAVYGDKYQADYFSDLYMVHQALGLGWQRGGVRMMSHLNAVKQHEVMLLADRLDDSFAECIYCVLAGYRDRLQVKSFNLALAFPPLVDVPGWDGFPLVARIVDRGNTADLSSDFSAMELYGASVVTSDPFHTAEILRGVNISEEDQDHNHHH